jgi:signal transduction histidine kinase
MDHINQSSAKLLYIVEAMIDVSLIEAGQLQIRNDEFHVNQLLRDIYHYFNIDRHRNSRNNIALLLNLDKSCEDLIIHTDQFRLHQVLKTFLGNAFKFTDKGFIEFGCHVKQLEKEIVFYVTDSGHGTLREQSRLVFEGSEKIDYTRNERFDSSVGLGLTLSKGIIKLLGGKIWTESNVFNGSTLKIALPYKRAIREMGSTTIQPFSNKLFTA